MKTQTLFRADDYLSACGDFIGIFATKQDALDEIEYTEECGPTEGKHSQITEFTIESAIDTDTMNEAELLDIWSKGEIKNTFHYC